MSKLTGTEHFIPAAAMPGISSQSTVAETLRTFQSRNVGGALLVEGDKPFAYIRGDDLGAAALEQSRQEGWGVIGQKTVTDVLRQAGRTLIPVRRPEPDADATALNAIQDFVVFEVEEGGIRLGWFLNHETLQRTMSTPPPTFECELGHFNDDPDHGYCSKCPAKLKAWKP